MRRFVILAVLVSVTLAVPLRAEDRGPSTLEERAKALLLVRALEANPIAPDAPQARKWLSTFLISVPDITVQVCGEFMKPLITSKKDYAAEIFSQSMYSAAAFVIEHPAEKDNVEARYLAGIEGSLRAYEALQKYNQTLIWPVLDDLIARRDAGKLAEFVHQKALACK